MTSRVPFFFVDVFASRPLTGNPLSLVPDADGLDEAQMRAIAREFNQSETTFLLRPSLPRASVRLRSFTPIGAEVGGAGHNALGAWLWMEAAGRLPAAGGDAGLRQEIAGQVLPVEVIRPAGQPATVWMDQSPPEFGAVARDRAALAAALGLGPDDLAADEPAQVVSTGADHLLVPARDRAAVDRAAPDGARLAPLLRQADGEGCYLYSTDAVDREGAVAYARFFNPTVGIAEDPATGTAAGPLVPDLSPGTAPIVDLHFDLAGTELRFFSVVSTIGAPIDVTAQELRVEAFFPADDDTRDRWTSLEASERAAPPPARAR